MEEYSSSTSDSIPTTNPGSDFWLTLTYVGLILFTLGYYNRPEDFLGGPYLPLAYVGGVLGSVACALYLLSGGRMQRTREAMALLALVGWMVLSIPFAYWKGGSFQIMQESVLKIPLVTIVMMSAITTLARLRKILAIQMLSVAGICWLAHTNFADTGRATGMNSSVFANSNNLAVLLCVNVPLVLFFLLSKGGIVKKVFVAAVMILFLETILLTYSRTGFLAMVVAILSLIWSFGIRAGHHGRVIVAVGILILMILAFLPSGYDKLIASIYDKQVDVSGTVRQDASESSEQRRQLMSRALELTLKHPVFGVGLQGFAELSGNWHVEHNTYLQFSAEAGIPALLLFLLLIWQSFGNLRNAEGLTVPGSEVWRLAVTLRASLWAFLVGAFFTNYAFEFFPYMIFAFAAVIHQIALHDSERVPHEAVVVEPELV